MTPALADVDVCFGFARLRELEVIGRLQRKIVRSICYTERLTLRHRAVMITLNKSVAHSIATSASDTIAARRLNTVRHLNSVGMRLLRMFIDEKAFCAAN